MSPVAWTKRFTLFRRSLVAFSFVSLFPKCAPVDTLAIARTRNQTCVSPWRADRSSLRSLLDADGLLVCDIGSGCHLRSQMLGDTPPPGDPAPKVVQQCNCFWAVTSRENVMALSFSAERRLASSLGFFGCSVTFCQNTTLKRLGPRFERLASDLEMNSVCREDELRGRNSEHC